MHGSVGDWTFAKKKDGTIIVKQKIEKTKHPVRTADNMPKRMRWANLARMWSLFDNKLKASFSRKAENISDFNAFMAANINNEHIVLPKSYVLQGGCVVGGYMISCGNLPDIKVTGAAGTAKASSLELGDGFAITEGTTLKAFSEAVVTHNTGFEYNDQLSCYIARQTSHANGCPQVEMEAYEVTLDNSDNGLLLRDIVNEKGFSVSNGKLAASEAVVGGIAWVHSRRKGSNVRVLTQYFLVDNPYIATYSSDGALTEAIQSYGGLREDPFLMPGSPIQSAGGDSPVPPTPVEPTTVTLTIQFSPENSGTAYVNDEEYTGPMELEKGKTVDLRFEPAAGFSFDRWSDNVRDAERSLTLTEDSTLTVSCSED